MVKASGGIPLGVWSGSDATNQLRETIIELSEATARQTRQMIRLTWTLVIMTAVLIAGLTIQIVLAV
jgi:hypothetical protein